MSKIRICLYFQAKKTTTLDVVCGLCGKAMHLHWITSAQLNGHFYWRGHSSAVLHRPWRDWNWELVLEWWLHYSWGHTETLPRYRMSLSFHHCRCVLQRRLGKLLCHRRSDLRMSGSCTAPFSDHWHGWERPENSLGLAVWYWFSFSMFWIWVNASCLPSPIVHPLSLFHAPLLF